MCGVQQRVAKVRVWRAADSVKGACVVCKGDITVLQKGRKE